MVLVVLVEREYRSLQAHHGQQLAGNSSVFSQQSIAFLQHFFAALGHVA